MLRIEHLLPDANNTFVPAQPHPVKSRRMSADRDPELPERLLLSERDALVPLLRAAPEADFARPTACPDWDVREILAHCSAALVRIVEGRLEPGVFSDASNAADVAERADWSPAQVVDELERAMTEAGPVIAGLTHGLLDTVALGEWVHAGDVRDAWGLPGAYADASGGDALALLTVAARTRRDTPLVRVTLSDSSAEPFPLGNPREGRPPAALCTDTPTLFRLYADRPLPDPAAYALSGATKEELHIYA